MAVIFFRSAIVSTTADKFYLGEVRGNNCQYGTKPGGCGKRTVLRETDGGETLQGEIWKGESRAALAVTRGAQGSLWVTVCGRLRGKIPSMVQCLMFCFPASLAKSISLLNE